MAEFASQEEYVAEIARRVGMAEAAEIAMQLDGLEKLPLPDADPPPGAPFHYINRHFRWVIADDDLKALDVVSDAVKAGAAAGFFVTHGPVTSAIVGMVLAGVKLLRQAAKKGTTVSPAQLRVLLILKSNRGLTTGELKAILDRKDSISESELKKLLGELEKISLDDGSVKGFVAKDGADRWHAAGV